MQIVVVLFVALNVSIRLVLPKFKLIWRGDKVVVSRILQEHRQSVEAKKQRRQPQISGLDLSTNKAGSNMSASYVGTGDTNSAYKRSGSSDALDSVLSEESTRSFAGEESRRRDKKSLLESSPSGDSKQIEPSSGGDELVLVKTEQAQPLRRRIVVNHEMVSLNDVYNQKWILVLDLQTYLCPYEFVDLLLFLFQSPPTKLTMQVVNCNQTLQRVNNVSDSVEGIRDTLNNARDSC